LGRRYWALEAAIADSKRPFVRIDQDLPSLGNLSPSILPNVAWGRISNHALWIRDALRDWVIRPGSFALAIDPRLVLKFALLEGCIFERDAVIYHHSMDLLSRPPICP